MSLGPSLGSTLAGPTSGGGHDAVVSATNTANIFRALAGAPPINVLESPLLTLTTGKGRTAAELARLAETVGARGAEGWRHSSQNGGEIGMGLARPSPCAPHSPPPSSAHRSAR